MSDLRKAHFNLGTAPQVTESSSQSQYRGQDQVNQPKNIKDVKDKMQKGSITIGDDKNRKI